MIKSFGNKLASDLFHGIASKETRKFPAELVSNAFRKLDAVNAATILEDLKIPPGNRLHKLSGDLEGYWSISINDQWRITFLWSDTDAEEVRVLDYH